MVRTEQLTQLAHIEASPENPVLSVYLNVDQSNAVNLNRGFEVPLKNMLRQMAKTAGTAGRADAFEADAAPVRNFIAEFAPANGTKTLALFSDAAAGLFETHTFSVPVENEVRWKAWPHLRPLAEAQAFYEPCGVILVDREKARLWVLRLGTVMEKGASEADRKSVV